jgi:2-keto-4-pentenoate hydratase/2-oxohepta-3-ene-1,7-dioic acid hydratase in catechol pathway
MNAPRRFGRFSDGRRAFYGLLEDDEHCRELPNGPFASLDSSGPHLPIARLEILVPCLASKILGVGRNYRAHASELGHPIPLEPLFFLKPPSALLPHGAAIRLPAASRRVDYEGEIGVVIGRTARAVPEERALDFVLGFTCVNDVTARDLQERDVQFTRAKGFDTFCPVGPWVTTGLDPRILAVETHVNGVRRQAAPASAMIFDIARLISEASRIMTLLPGDLISTGTPEGVGPLRPGDEVSVAVEGVGRLTNRVEIASGMRGAPEGGP